MNYKRNRLLYAVMIIVIIILGLFSRNMANMLPDFSNTYLGDALWALMIYIAVGFIFREVKIKTVAVIAICFCYLIEISQLYHANWIDGIRRTALGGLVLGYGFLWSDLLAYAIGAGAGVVIETLWVVIQKNWRLKMKRITIFNFIPIIVAAPATIIGAIAMRNNNVPATIFGQNIFYILIAGLISCFIISKKYKVKRRKPNLIAILVAVMLLFLTFISSGIEGVQRWVAIGPIRLYASVIVLPIVIIESWKLLQIKKWWTCAAITLIISTLLLFQPDASQLTAFAISMIIMLWNKTNNKIFRYSITLVLSVFIICSWILLDSLPPVAYVEEIVNLVADMGITWLILGVSSLMILPFPFIFFPPRKNKLLSRCIGLYFIITLSSTLFGNFPVPLMGYGVSPIIGYFIAITWMVKCKINS